MRLTKGKWVASYKDTWCLRASLSPIIAAGIRRYIEVEKHGIPGGDSELGELDKYFCYIDWKAAEAKWNEILEEILYAFDNPEEPEVPDGMYNWKFENAWIPHPDPGMEDYCMFDGDYAKRHTDQELKEKHDKECKEWYDRRKRGLELFTKYFDNLWW